MATTKKRVSKRGVKVTGTIDKRQMTDKMVVYWPPETIKKLESIAEERGLSSVSDLVRKELNESLGLGLSFLRRKPPTQ